jgi:Trk K+ transport system NAD-binding subunit
VQKLTGGIARLEQNSPEAEVIEFTAGSGAHNRTVEDLQIPDEFRLCLVTRNGSSFIPWQEDRIRDGDTVLAVVKAGSYEKIRPITRQAVRHVEPVPVAR